MRKFYSIVLTACALLLSTSLFAETQRVDSRRSLQDAIDATPAGGTVNILLTTDINIARDEMPIRVYGNHDQANKTVNLDLGGNSIIVGDSRAIELLKGNLNISNGTITKTKSVPYHTAAFYDTYDKNNKPIYYSGGLIGGKTLYNCTEKSDSKGAYCPDEAILVCGSYDPNAENWAVLTIGKDVLVQTICPDNNTDGGSGIAMLELQSWINSTASTVANFECTEAVATNTDGGMTWTPRDYWKNENGDMVVDYCTHWYANYSGTANAQGKYPYINSGHPSARKQTQTAFGAVIDVYGKVYGGEYGIKITGNFFRTDGFVPYVHIRPSAEVWSKPNTKGTTGVYSSGVGKWLIEGYVHGSTGVYVKSGDVEIKNARIESDYTGSYAEPEGTRSGIKSGGSAIVVESTAAYAGSHDVTISGDTKIKGGTGYAIEEVITDTPEGDSKVDYVKIEGGTIEAGTQGTAVFAEATADGQKVSIVGGNIEDKVSIKNGDGSTSQAEVADFFPNDGKFTTTEVEGENGKKIVVITKFEENVEVLTSGTVAAAAAAGKGIKWTGTSEKLEKANATEVTLPYLEINDNKTQTLTVEEGVTLTVGRIVMGSLAQIIVEAGAGLIVTGEQGMVANATDNVVLEANASKQATFVISPKVTSNKQPMASVRYYTDAYGMPKTGTSTNYKWDRLTSPLSEYSKISSNYSTLETKPELLDGETGIWTFIEYYDELSSKWVGLTAYNQMKAFTSYALSNNTKAGGITYTFEGRVQGNVADRIELDHAGWNYMGNAFVAPIHVRTMLQAIENSGADIDGSMYLWDMANQKYNPVNKALYSYFSAGPKEIPAMQTFIVKLTSGNSAMLDLDYATSVYGYVTNPNTYSAPRRAVASDVNTLRINIKAANGAEDDVYFVESAEFTEDYDNGADITKYMNKGMNFYANGEYAMVASDNIEGATLSLQTIDEVDYTLTFAEVNGEEYALRDNLTGRVVLMSEGATYRFTAQPNQIVESRFQIVPRQQMPTDISTANETAGSKAVYTVLGQYVGETENWNQLPAGIYVVDGIKIVK